MARMKPFPRSVCTRNAKSFAVDPFGTRNASGRTFPFLSVQWVSSSTGYTTTRFRSFRTASSMHGCTPVVLRSARNASIFRRPASWAAGGFAGAGVAEGDGGGPPPPPREALRDPIPRDPEPPQPIVEHPLHRRLLEFRPPEDLVEVPLQ